MAFLSNGKKQFFYKLCLKLDVELRVGCSAVRQAGLTTGQWGTEAFAAEKGACVFLRRGFR